MDQYGLSGTKHIYNWAATVTDSARFEQLLLWMQVATRDPQEVATGVVEKQGRLGRVIYFADVPVAETRVTFIIVDVPARCLHILSIDDETYQVD